MVEEFVACCLCNKQAIIAEDVGDDTFGFCGDECYNDLLEEYEFIGVSATRYLKKLKRIITSTSKLKNKSKDENNEQHIPTFLKYKDSLYYTLSDGMPVLEETGTSHTRVKIGMNVLNTRYEYFDRDGQGFKAFETPYYMTSDKALGTMVYANFEQTNDGDLSYKDFTVKKDLPRIKHIANKDSKIDFNISIYGKSFNVLLPLTGEINNDEGKYIYMVRENFLVIEVKKSGRTKDAIDITRIEYYIPKRSFSSGNVLYKESVPAL